jgi:hypothetical protein
MRLTTAALSNPVPVATLQQKLNRGSFGSIGMGELAGDDGRGDDDDNKNNCRHGCAESFAADLKASLSLRLLSRPPWHPSLKKKAGEWNTAF